MHGPFTVCSPPWSGWNVGQHRDPSAIARQVANGSDLRSHSFGLLTPSPGFFHSGRSVQLAVRDLRNLSGVTDIRFHAPRRRRDQMCERERLEELT
jgi:hypothetical protein